MTRLIRLAALPALLALTGCGEKTTDVTGKVTYKGKALVYGTVAVLDGGPAPKVGAIQPDGTFRVNGVRPGAHKVAVSSAAPPGSDAAKKSADRREADDERTTAAVTPAPPEVLKGWFAIPDKYGDPTKSELTADVKVGQPLDIDLK
jgi:hypothetical protein